MKQRHFIGSQELMGTDPFFSHSAPPTFAFHNQPVSVLKAFQLRLHGHKEERRFELPAGDSQLCLGCSSPGTASPNQAIRKKYTVPCQRNLNIPRLPALKVCRELFVPFRTVLEQCMCYQEALCGNRGVRKINYGTVVSAYSQWHNKQPSPRAQGLCRPSKLARAKLLLNTQPPTSFWTQTGPVHRRGKTSRNRLRDREQITFWVISHSGCIHPLTIPHIHVK